MMFKKEFITETIKTVLIAFVLAFLLIKFIMVPCVVEGTSMYPILQENDFGYSFIITRNIKIDRFDIVVIQVGDEENSKLLVKRVIGLPNETITYTDNKLYINGEYIEESFLNSSVLTNDFTVTINDDEYFCLGDNRPLSRDSRFYGAFNKEDILSTHMFVIYPFKDFGLKD